MFNYLSVLLRVELGTQIDVWSLGCLVGLYTANGQFETDITIDL